MHDFPLHAYIENVQIWTETNMNLRTKLPARKSLFSSKPITAMVLTNTPPQTSSLPNICRSRSIYPLVIPDSVLYGLDLKPCRRASLQSSAQETGGSPHKKTPSGTLTQRRSKSLSETRQFRPSKTGFGIKNPWLSHFEVGFYITILAIIKILLRSF